MSDSLDMARLLFRGMEYSMAAMRSVKPQTPFNWISRVPHIGIYGRVQRIDVRYQSLLGQDRSHAKTAVSRWIDVGVTRRRGRRLAHRWRHSAANRLAEGRDRPHHTECQEHETSVEGQDGQYSSRNALAATGADCQPRGNRQWSEADRHRHRRFR